MSREDGGTQSTNTRPHVYIYRNRTKRRSSPRQEGLPASPVGLPSPSDEGLRVKDAKQALGWPVRWHTALGGSAWTKQDLRDRPGLGKPSLPARAPSSMDRAGRPYPHPEDCRFSPGRRHRPWGLGHILPLPVLRAPPTHGLSLGPGSAPPGY
ncbi:unnamed protein product, partial [Gulo gulo]